MPFGTACVRKVAGDSSPRTQSPVATQKCGLNKGFPSRCDSKDSSPAPFHQPAAQLESLAEEDAARSADLGPAENAGGSEPALWGTRSIATDIRSQSIIGEDERTRITPCTSQPYQWIVSLGIRFPNNVTYKGSGSIIRMDNTPRVVILTCAHNLYSAKNGGYAAEVTVVAGRDGANAPYGSYKITPADYEVPPEYVPGEDKKFDFAAIFLKADAINRSGFGCAALNDDELKGRIVETSGYPGDKPDGTMWLSGGIVTAVDDFRFHYTNDTMGGSSGGPVWTWATHNFVLVGIHGLGHGTTNSSRRVDQKLIERVTTWSKGYQ